MITTVTTKNAVDKKQKNLTMSKSTRERIMSSTVSADEYFDELIAQVHEDYADI